MQLRQFMHEAYLPKGAAMFLVPFASAQFAFMDTFCTEAAQ